MWNQDKEWPKKGRPESKGVYLSSTREKRLRPSLQHQPVFIRACLMISACYCRFLHGNLLRRQSSSQLFGQKHVSLVGSGIMKKQNTPKNSMFCFITPDLTVVHVRKHAADLKGGFFHDFCKSPARNEQKI